MQGSSAGDDRPNVVVIMTDDQEVGTLKVMPEVREQLGRKGTTFRNAVATYPLCCPSRATFLTGQYAHNHGVLSNKPPEGGYNRFRDPPDTLPIALQEAGYRTGHVGKYLNGYGTRGNDPREVPSGWDDWQGFPRFTMYDYPVNENGEIRSYGTDEQDYQTDVISQKATTFIREGAEGPDPFFLSVATLAPHTESTQRDKSPNPRPAPRHRGRFQDAAFPTPPSFNEANVSDKPAFVQKLPRLSDREQQVMAERYRDRLASLLAVDELVGAVVAELRRSGELDDTVIAFTSDNGYFLGEHRLKGKSDLYEESARVPLIVRGPQFPIGAKAPQLVGNIDLAPTIAELAGAELGREVDGRSLVPFAQNPSFEADRDILLEEKRSSAVRTPDFMYAEHPRGDRELYDLRSDPFQLRSLHADPEHADLVDDLAERLQELEDCAGEGCR